jgi:hypothetical protein
VLRLVEKQPDSSIIAQLNDMLRDAEKGKVIGLLAAAHYGGSAYGYYGGGSMCNTPSVGLAAIYNLTTKLLTGN